MPKKTIKTKARKKKTAKKGVKRKVSKKIVKKIVKKTIGKEKLTKADIDCIKNEFQNEFENEEDALFFAEWITNGRNAAAAYQKLHPDVTWGTAKTMGSRVLARVDRSIILEMSGLGMAYYIEQLKQGLEATDRIILAKSKGVGKNRRVVEEIIEQPDHKTRRPYHKALGEILGLESKNATSVQVNNQNNINNTITQKRNQYGI